MVLDALLQGCQVAIGLLRLLASLSQLGGSNGTDPIFHLLLMGATTPM